MRVMRICTLLVAVGALALYLPALTSAHHSRAEFADEVTEIEAELVRVHWRNPHAGLDVRVLIVRIFLSGVIQAT